MIDNGFNFDISLSVLNHLGRNLYRSFTTVLGEAISNAWDADAKNVNIFIDKEGSGFVIKDDGIGMSKDDFQGKFLKIGYSKRKEWGNVSPGGRPYIWRKWIWKLALLSCADRITVISKTKSTSYVGWVIDNSELDNAIDDDLSTVQYKLGSWDEEMLTYFSNWHEKGTIILFEWVKEWIRNSLEQLRKTVAMFFRFSLIDPDFKIFIDGQEVTIDDLENLAENTEFLWRINDFSDPYIDTKLKALKFPEGSEVPPGWRPVSMSSNVRWFIASVQKPSNLNIFAAKEKISIDLFVNWRLREKDILKHAPSSKVVESYLYGQIHFDSLNDGEDRFTSSREGIVADDPLFNALLAELRAMITWPIAREWDKWRLANWKEWDDEDPSVSIRDRRAKGLFSEVSKTYSLSSESPEKRKVDKWIKELGDDAEFNIGSYAECFISENLVRRYISEKWIPLSKEALRVASEWKKTESWWQERANLSIDIRKDPSDLSYLDMWDLTALADKYAEDGTRHDKNLHAHLMRDETAYTPVRNAVAHTALLTDNAKRHLTTVYENLKARIVRLLSRS